VRPDEEGIETTGRESRSRGTGESRIMNKEPRFASNPLEGIEDTGDK
jgi:hypothetical protein